MIDSLIVPGVPYISMSKVAAVFKGSVFVCLWVDGRHVLDVSYPGSVVIDVVEEIRSP